MWSRNREVVKVRVVRRLEDAGRERHERLTGPQRNSLGLSKVNLM